MPRTKIHNGSETHDSRDIIARIEELETERDTYDGERGEERDPWTAVYPEDAAELTALQKLAAEAEGYAADWHHGEILIRDDYFTDYACEMLKDCGVIPRDLPWYVEIDWEATARNVLMDYTAVYFDGVTYWIR